MAAEQDRPWNIRLFNMQEELDVLDVFRKVTGLRMQDIYNKMLGQWVDAGRGVFVAAHACHDSAVSFVTSADANRDLETAAARHRGVGGSELQSSAVPGLAEGRPAFRSLRF
jgi:hypothetical protein